MSWSAGSLCTPAPSQNIGRELGAHKRSHPDLKLLTKLEMSSPDLSEVRVQRLTMLETSSPDLSAERVQRRASVQCVSANPNEVRVRGAKVPELFSFFSYTLERNLVSVEIRPFWSLFICRKLCA